MISDHNVSLPFLCKYFVPPGFEEYREFLAVCNKKLLTDAKSTSKQLNIYKVVMTNRSKTKEEKYFLYMKLSSD